MSEQAERERLLAICAALGLPPVRAEAEASKWGADLQVVMHAVLTGWTPEREVSPAEYLTAYRLVHPDWATLLFGNPNASKPPGLLKWTGEKQT